MGQKRERGGGGEFKEYSVKGEILEHSSLNLEKKRKGGNGEEDKSGPNVSGTTRWGGKKGKARGEGRSPVEKRREKQLEQGGGGRKKRRKCC